MPMPELPMYQYFVYRLQVHSTIPLPGPLAPPAAADVVVKLGAIPPAGPASADQTNQRLTGELDQIGRVFITNGNSITIDPLAGVGPDLIAPNILGGGMAVILRQRGYLVLHASAVVMDQGVVAFLGGSGWGKSTLAASLHGAGHRVLTDDVMALQLGPSWPLVIPSFPQCKLAPEAAAALGQDPTTLAPIFAQAHKRAYPLTQGFQAEPLPLRAIYILARGNRHQITPLAPQQAFVDLVSHTRAMAALTDPISLQTHFQQCVRLLQQVPCYQFVRKPGLAELPTLVRLVEDHGHSQITAEGPPNDANLG